MTAHETNIYRYMKECYERYSEHLKIAKKHNRVKVIKFLEKYLVSLENNIKKLENDK